MLVKSKLDDEIEDSKQKHNKWVSLGVENVSINASSSGRVLRRRNSSGSNKRAKVYNFSSDEDDFESPSISKSIVNVEKVTVVDAEDLKQNNYALNDNENTRVPGINNDMKAAREPKSSDVKKSQTFNFIGDNTNTNRNQAKIVADDLISTEESADEEVTVSDGQVDEGKNSNSNLEESNECPMCQRSFRLTQLEAHAYDCQGVREQRKTKNQVLANFQSKLCQAKSESRNSDLISRINSAASGSGVNIKPRARVPLRLNLSKNNGNAEESNDEIVEISPSPILSKRVRRPPDVGGAEWAAFLDS